jgi:PHD/YefM family antitoxin component YafN of YafNO toxin-antitoxin module
MKIMSQSQARKNLFSIAKEVNETGVPVMATNKDTDKDIVILAKTDWDMVQETMYVYGTAGMADKLEAAHAEEGTPFSGNLEDLL